MRTVEDRIEDIESYLWRAGDDAMSIRVDRLEHFVEEVKISTSASAKSSRDTRNIVLTAVLALAGTVVATGILYKLGMLHP